VGSGNPGVGAGICWLSGGSDGSFACAEGTARNVVTARAATSVAAAERFRNIRGGWGCINIFALLEEFETIRGRWADARSKTPAPLELTAISGTPSFWVRRDYKALDIGRLGFPVLRL
jgi:hypothetical protein